jgi:hypothetical protein
MMQPAFSSFFAALLIAVMAVKADTPPPLRFGPFIQQDVILEGSPTGFGYVPPTGWYSAQAGWMEPLNIFANPWFHQTYLETQANTTISPYQADIGMMLNLKPLRFFEGGVGYNRIVYPYTLIGFVRPADSPSTWLPDREAWRTRAIFDARKDEGVGADVFTFHGDLNADIGKLQLRAGATRSLWDVDITDRDIIYDYRSGLLIQKRDRLSSFYGQALFNTSSDFGDFSMHGWEIRDQYWSVTHTGLSEDLISGGFSGLRHGHNSERSYHGLDGLVGFWISQPQLNDQAWWKHLQITLQWMWNIQILNLGEN